MPVFSYLAYPIKGAKARLSAELNATAHCQATPAQNVDLLILVTDTPDEDAERRLQKKLKNIKTLQSLAMTFGHVDQ